MTNDDGAKQAAPADDASAASDKSKPADAPVSATAPAAHFVVKGGIGAARAAEVKQDAP